MWLGGTTVPQNNPEITRNNVHLTVVIMYDKTFNLGPLHLTVTVFKQHSVTRMATNDNPIFFGPMCLHGNSNRSMWTAFFQHLATALDGCEKFLVFGTDNERALTSSIDAAFKNCHLVCYLLYAAGHYFQM